MSRIRFYSRKIKPIIVTTPTQPQRNSIWTLYSPLYVQVEYPQNPLLAYMLGKTLLHISDRQGKQAGAELSQAQVYFS